MNRATLYLPEAKCGPIDPDLLDAATRAAPAHLRDDPQSLETYLQQNRMLLREIVGAYEAKNWSRYVRKHVITYTPHALFSLQYQGTEAEQAYWPTLFACWTTGFARPAWKVAQAFGASAAPHYNHALWGLLFNSPLPGMKNALTYSEQRALDDLPGVLEVYRGSPEDTNRYLSWTTSLRVARRFAHKRKGGAVWVTVVPRCYVIACVLRVGESELIINLPDEVKPIALDELHNV